MDDSKYSPLVNMPENVPQAPSPADITVIFLLAGQNVMLTANKLGLWQVRPGWIGLATERDGQVTTFLTFPGTLTTEVKP